MANNNRVMSLPTSLRTWKSAENMHYKETRNFLLHICGENFNFETVPGLTTSTLFAQQILVKQFLLGEIDHSRNMKVGHGKALCNESQSDRECKL